MPLGDVVVRLWGRNTWMGLCSCTAMVARHADTMELAVREQRPLKVF